MRFGIIKMDTHSFLLYIIQQSRSYIHQAETNFLVTLVSVHVQPTTTTTANHVYIYNS
jgi:hypothetical protein